MDTPDGHEVGAPDGLKRGPSQGNAGDGGERGDHQILLVEDNPGDVALFREAIDESDVHGDLRVATCGNDALSILHGGDRSTARASTEFDIVVLDLDLPGTPGFAVLEELKGDPRTRSVPVVVLSSSDDEEEVHRAYDLGANAYLVKRMHFRDTVAMVDAIEAFWFEAAELPE